MDPKRGMEEQNLLCRASSGSSSGEGRSGDYELDAFENEDARAQRPRSSRPQWLHRWNATRRFGRPISTAAYFSLAIGRRRRSLLCQLLHILSLVLYTCFALVFTIGIFFPSYTHPPQRYIDLQRRVSQANFAGAANVNNEKVFIAASLYDPEGELLSGEWGIRVRRLVDILGPENVYLSIYENDPDKQAQKALGDYGALLPCNSSTVSEHLDLNQLPHVLTPDGKERLKRIGFLAEVRNRALKPLEDSKSSAYATIFDKLLYMNDVMFDPVDAANLLFSTNVDEGSGRTQYRAACSMDFINPFKFYDTFATRDTEGYDMGVPFYPWFTAAGNGTSRRQVLAQQDAVNVKSCWGGMVAFEAKWFQQRAQIDAVGAAPSVANEKLDSLATSTTFPDSWTVKAKTTPFSTPPAAPNFRPDTDENLNWGLASPFGGSSLPRSQLTPRDAPSTSQQPVRFRAETDTYWDGSECCLIHADISNRDVNSLVAGESGIYMNPYIRVAYDKRTLAWLAFARRFERLYSPIQHFINVIASRPSYNPRRLQWPGDEVLDRVWIWDEATQLALVNGTTDMLPDGLRGSFQEVRRTATAGQFCGSRTLLYINEHPKEGEKHWGSEPLPLGN